jgi:LysM repeat protein
MGRSRRSGFRLVTLLMLLVAVALGAGALLGKDHSPPPPMQTVTVAQGDTVWEIAARYGPPHTDVRITVDAICEANGLRSARLVVGQKLLVPRER